MHSRALAVVVVAGLLGLAAPTAAGAQATPIGQPDAVKAALLAFNLYHQSVTYEAGTSGFGSDGAVVVTLFGPPAFEMPDQIFRVVWATEPLRFSDVVVRWTGGEARRSYADLAAELGSRPAGYDQLSIAFVMITGWTLFPIDLGPLLATVTMWLKIFAISLGSLIGLWIAIGIFRRRPRPDAPVPS